MLLIKNPSEVNLLRRVALSAQGLLKAQTFGRGLKAAIHAINHIGYVQLDTISVVERAHHHVLYSRVPGFKPAMLETMMQQGEIFEYWSHAAAVLPIKDFRYSLPYKHAIKSGQSHWFKKPDRKMMKELLARIEIEGPLRSRDLEVKAQSGKTGSGWWDWKPAKKALEQLYMQGDVMVSKREGFQKTYDLTERVLPSNVDNSVPNTNEFAVHLLNQQLRCHGIVSLKGLTYLRKNSALRKAMKSLIDEQVSQQHLLAIQLKNNEVYFIESNLIEKSMPRVSNRMAILSPFDNSVIQRDRLNDLFKYEYKIECYLPASKRQYGYFCLPLLYKGEFIGRMDCKAHRKDKVLEVKSLYFESNKFDQDDMFDAFVSALRDFRDFQNCNHISLAAAIPAAIKNLL